MRDGRPEDLEVKSALAFTNLESVAVTGGFRGHTLHHLVLQEEHNNTRPGQWLCGSKMFLQKYFELLGTRTSSEKYFSTRLRAAL